MKRIALFFIIWIGICSSVYAQFSKNIITNQSIVKTIKLGEYDKVFLDKDSYTTDVASRGNLGYFTGNYATVYKTDDFGRTWTQQLLSEHLESDLSELYSTNYQYVEIQLVSQILGCAIFEQTLLKMPMKQMSILGNSVWTEYSIDSRSNSITSKRQYWIDGDTIINEQTYKKIIQDDQSYLGAIREDNEKVYAILKWEENEFLLCDYAVQVGDVVNSTALEGELSFPHTVERIEEITMETGEKRKLFFLEGGMTWIEGVGSIYGLFYDAMWHASNYITTKLVCFKQGNEIIYRDEEWCQFNNCCDNIIPETKNNNPSPVIKTIIRKENNQIVIVFPEAFLEETTIRLFNPMGNCVYTKTTLQSFFELNISVYPRGIYLISIQNGNNIEYYKFIK